MAAAMVTAQTKDSHHAQFAYLTADYSSHPFRRCIHAEEPPTASKRFWTALPSCPSPSKTHSRAKLIVLSTQDTLPHYGSSIT